MYFFKTGELNGSNYAKIPLRSNAILKIENNDKYCFIWSLLASLHPCNDIYPNRVSIYKKYSNELNIQAFDFTNGFKCNDIHKFNELNNLSINIFEVFFIVIKINRNINWYPLKFAKKIQIELLTY